MVGSPSQAGIFKPRKPAKKILVGVTTPAADAAVIASASAAPATTSRRRSRSSSGRGTGGRGRGGRGGSNRATPVPHGAVFFTGNAPSAEAESISATRRSSAASTTPQTIHSSSVKRVSTRQKPSPEQSEKTEELVVGELDVAIGNTQDKVLKIKNEPTEDESAREGNERIAPKAAAAIMTPALEPLVDTYDSDSSEDERQTTGLGVAPTELPFPVKCLPVGIGGGHERAVMYSCQHPEQSKNEKYEPPVIMDEQQDRPLVSPFGEVIQAEKDSWFIFQFPTRLPRFTHAAATTAVPDPVKSEEPSVVGSSVAVDTPESTAANVTTPYTVTNSFDNVLTTAPPGKLGKILVYKSGKTVLVMGDDGTSEVRMNVTEGLPCGFVQQAVAIDTSENTYIYLGDVHKTVVVTPDVAQAFSSS